YQINNKKTRLLRPGSQRKIVGLIYSDDQKIGIGRKQKKLLRAKIHNYITKTGKYPDTTLNSILSWISFVKDVDPEGYKQLTYFWRDLKKKEDNKREELEMHTSLF